MEAGSSSVNQKRKHASIGGTGKAKYFLSTAPLFPPSYLLPYVMLAAPNHLWMTSVSSRVAPPGTHP